MKLLKPTNSKTQHIGTMFVWLCYCLRNNNKYTFPISSVNAIFNKLENTGPLRLSLHRYPMDGQNDKIHNQHPHG
jgi:hypothetical protein